eukprot:2727935-Pleurochrysis_carterae.AAC.1
MASFNALLNKRGDTPARSIGTLHSDNAGEFLSAEFTEFWPRIACTTLLAHRTFINSTVSPRGPS